MTAPTTERLALALTKVGAPPGMIAKAREGYYDDYKSPLAMPLMQLVADAREARLPKSFVRRVMDGDFDATKEESDAWAASPEGQATFQEFLKGGGHGPHPNDG